MASLAGASLLTLMMACAWPAYAQSADQEAGQAGANSASDDIVVTATSIASIDERPILDTPRSVSAVNSATIANIAPSSLQEVTKLFPTLTPRAAYNDPTQRFFARGINAATTQRDGLQWRDNFLPIEEVERIEVLQGVPDVSQGGDKTPGGVINFVPKRAIAGDFARLTAGVNEYGNLLGQADINLGLDRAERFAVRANLAAERIRLPDDTDGHRYAVALAASGKLTPDLTLDINGFYTRQKRHDVNSGFFPRENDVDLPQLSYTKNYGQPWSYDDFERNGIEAKLSGNLAGGWALLVQAGYSGFDALTVTPGYGNLKSSGAAEVTGSYFDSRVRNFGARAAVTKAFEITSALTNKIAVIGTYYTDKLRFAGQDVPAGSANLYGDQNVAAPAFNPPRLHRGNKAVVKTIGVNDEVTWNETFTLTAGVQRYDVVNDGYDNAGALVNRQHLTTWLPNASALFKVTPRWSIYGTYNEAVEQGSNVYPPFANQGEQLAPLRSKTYEIGTKVQISRLIATLAAYTFNRPAEIAVGNRLEQAGSSRYRGIDLTVSGAIMPKLTLIGGVSYINATIRAADDPAIIGKTPTNVPHFSSSLLVEYQLVPGLFASAGVFHVTRKPGDDANSFYVPGYTTFDLGGRYETTLAGRRTTFRIEATNVTNKFYYASSIFASPIYGSPRFLKASVTVEY